MNIKAINQNQSFKGAMSVHCEKLTSEKSEALYKALKQVVKEAETAAKEYNTDLFIGTYHKKNVDAPIEKIIIATDDYNDKDLWNEKIHKVDMPIMEKIKEAVYSLGIERRAFTYWTNMGRSGKIYNEENGIKNVLVYNPAPNFRYDNYIFKKDTDGMYKSVKITDA